MVFSSAVSNSDSASGESELPLFCPHAEVTVDGLRSPHLTVPRVKPAINVLGFRAAGRAGNASVLRDGLFRPVAAGVVEEPERGTETLDVLRDPEEGRGGNDVPDEGVDDGAPPHVPADFDFDVFDGPASGGNGLLESFPLLKRLPLRPTADCEDCAVEDFSLSTRFPLAPAPLVGARDVMPLGAGRAG